MIAPSKISPKMFRAAVYGANDGIITTFAVVAGVAGAGLSANIVLILGIANLVADGLSMGLGDFLGERSEQKLRKERKQTFTEVRLWETGLITFLSFAVAGFLPLLPYSVDSLGVLIFHQRLFLSSIITTGATLFLVGSARSVLTKEHWFVSGLEMFGVGALAATVAFCIGALIKSLI